MDERATGQPIRFEHYRVSTDEQGRPLKLGEGAMGVTYLAEDTNLKVRVALKVIRPQLLGDAEVGQRFQREAQAAARLRHPNVAGVYHLGMVDNTFFYAMEFVEGETLKDRVQRNGPLPLKEALEVALQVCEALGAAEKHKMVHRDIKPANIMLEAIEDDLLRVKLIDFGLAKPLHAEAQNSIALQTQAGIFLGTPVFASPEQIQDVPPDSRADFYSLGLTLWFMLEGRTPFEGSLHKVLFDQVHTAPPLGRLLWVPAEIRDLLGKMLEKDPANRPQSARELRQKIHDCLRALATSGTTYSEWQQRFQVEGKPRSQPWGMIFEGQDTLSGAVRLHLLRNDRFSDPKAIQGVIGDARRAIDIHHPNILRHLTVFPTSGAQGAGWMVVTEHPGTQTLLDHLRKVKQLPPAETIAIIDRLASAIDTCIVNDLITADLDPAGIFLKQVPRTEIHALTQTATRSAVSAAVTTAETFEVVPKLSPINYSFLTTLRPADETAIGMTQGAFRTEATTPQELVQRLALLAYQCMGGAVASTWSRVPRFIPLATLSQRQNDTLRSALTDSTWTRAADFVEAFQQTKTTRRSDETSRVSTSTEATVMLTSWRMLADLASADSGEYSTEHGKEFTGKIERQEIAPAATPGETPAPEPEVAELPATESAGVEQIHEAPAADSHESISDSSASVADSTLTTERTQTWGRTDELSESPAAETSEANAESVVAAPPVDLDQQPPEETETLILSTGVAELLVTAAPPEIKNEIESNVGAQTSTQSVASAPASAQPETAEPPVDESPEPEKVSDTTDLSTSSAELQAPATEMPASEPPTSHEKIEAAPTSPGANIAPRTAQEPPPPPSTSINADAASAPPTASSPEEGTATSGTPSSIRPAHPLSTSAPTSPASTTTSAIPLPPQVRLPQRIATTVETFGARLKSLPRWVLPVAAALATLILIAGFASLMRDDADHPADPGRQAALNPPHPPEPPPPALPTLPELLATAGTAASTGDLAKLDDTLETIHARFPDLSWEADPAAGEFRESLFRAYRGKKLGNDAAALRKHRDIFLAATLVREPDIPLLKQITEDLASSSDAALAEPFEKAYLNALAADPTRREDRLDESLAFIKKRPDSVVAAVARGILSKELEESVDYLEQNPRDQSQNEALKIALEALMPRMQELANAAVPEAWYILGDQALKAGSPLAAMRLFEKAAEEHHPPSMRRYGIALTNRVAGREPDMVAAAEWLRYAVAAGDLKANLFLADIYLPDKPSSTRPRKAREAYDLLNAAAEGGVPDAHYLLGSMLLDSPADDSAHGFASSIKNPAREVQAVEHLRKAVAGKASRAYQKLANALLSKRQITEAVAILEEGTKLSPPDPLCMYNLSMLYNPYPPELPISPDELAAAGVRPDADRSRKLYDESLSLMRTAARSGEPDAIEFCEKRRISYK